MQKHFDKISKSSYFQNGYNSKSTRTVNYGKIPLESREPKYPTGNVTKTKICTKVRALPANTLSKIQTDTVKCCLWRRVTARLPKQNFPQRCRSQKRFYTTSKTFLESARTNCEWKKKFTVFRTFVQDLETINWFSNFRANGENEKYDFSNRWSYEIETRTKR